MLHLKELQCLLSAYLKLSPARLECLCHMVIGILTVNDINLKKLAKTFCSNTLMDSSYKRMQRFLKHVEWKFTWLWSIIEKQFDLDEVFFALDRTNWKFGKININILTLAVCYRGIALPFVWTMLDKRGNSNSEERCKLLDELLSIISSKRIKAILGDREFVGELWLKALLERGISFVMQTRENILITNAKGVPFPAELLLRNLAIGQVRVLSGKRMVMGCDSQTSFQLFCLKLGPVDWYGQDN